MEKKTFANDLNVLNALNLINPALGKAYKEKGYNPFDEDFVLRKEYVEELLTVIKNRKSVPSENFLEQGNKQVQNNFLLALENVGNILEELENINANKKNLDLKKVLVYLKNRKELLLQAIEKLNSSNANSLELYEDIVNLDNAYSEILKHSFFENFNKQVAINQFLSLVMPAKIVKNAPVEAQEFVLAQEKQKIIEPKKEIEVKKLAKEKEKEEKIVKPVKAKAKEKEMGIER